MNKALFFFFFICCFGFSNAQLTITEIMYNPPESGADSLEFIEISNTSGSMLDLSGYTFTAGVDFTFPAMNLGPNEYLLLAGNASAISNNFGLTALEWAGGALSNSGESIEIRDGGGNLVDLVNYDDMGAFPSGPDGSGPSLVLCDIDANNEEGGFWLSSENATGVMINGMEIFASPGVENLTTCSVADNVVETDGSSFAPQDITINVGESVEWISGTPEPVNVNGSWSVYPDNPEGFDNGAPISGPWSFRKVFSIPGIYNYQSDGNSAFFGTVTVNGSRDLDLMITEIMYNNPGSDDMEFVEIYNFSQNDIDMTGFLLTNGIFFEFPSFTLASDEYVIVAGDSAVFETVTGITPFDYGGTLGNSGETIELHDSSGLVVDFVTYASSGDWDAGADGTGSSLALCQPGTNNNNGLNWSASSDDSGIDP